MASIGAYEAKTHLPQLLARVARGERIIITRHGMPVAELAPAGKVTPVERIQLIEKIIAFRRDKDLGGMSIKEMIEEGRR